MLDRAAASLRSDPVYVDPDAQGPGAIDDDAAESLRRRIRSSGSADLPGRPARVRRPGGRGRRQPPAPRLWPPAPAWPAPTAWSRWVTATASGPAPPAAPRAGPGRWPRPPPRPIPRRAPRPCSTDFVNRVAEAQGGRVPTQNLAPSTTAAATEGIPAVAGRAPCPCCSSSGPAVGGSGTGSARRPGRRAAEDRRNRSVLEAQLAVLADDVVNLGPQVDLHPDARPDYDAAVSRYRVAQAALENSDDPIDLVRVGRLLDEASLRHGPGQGRGRGAGAATASARSHPARSPGRASRRPRRRRPAGVRRRRVVPLLRRGLVRWWRRADDRPVPRPDAGRRLGRRWGGHDTNVYVDNSDGDGGRRGRRRRRRRRLRRGRLGRWRLRGLRRRRLRGAATSAAATGSRSARRRPGDVGNRTNPA